MSSLNKVRELDAHIEQNRAYICSLAARLGKTYKIEKDDAEQEAFLAAWKAVQTFDGRSHVRTFITRSVINHFLNLARKKNQIFEDAIQLDAFEDADEIAEATEFASVPSPEDILSDIEVLELFYIKLEMLDEDIRHIIERRICGDASFAEIAKELRTPVVNVRVKLHRAIRNLRRDILGR